ncbi:digestive cysteine proteinase 1-like [Euwallacea fornicatus]|uniref:digestive cysteine proteinase 1-like n=1 Tax=Euwallacea fornicatus TaxID=995702 RepID=UPI00338DA0C7
MFVKVFLISCLVLVASASEEEWTNYKTKFEKVYASEAEHQVRYQAFKTNLQKIQEHNAKYDQGLVTWYMAVNKFTDLTAEEFEKQYLSYQMPTLNQSGKRIHQTSVSAPGNIDWRDYNYVTEVKDQGQCGSCWTFSATGTLEGAFAKSRLQLVSFSEQEILDCATESAGYNGAGCNGGVVQSALDYVRDRGIVYEGDYPYEARQQSCRQNGNVFQISGYTEIGSNDENGLRDAVGNVGPVSVALNAADFQNYGGGIYDNPGCSTAINHGVLAVGYNSENGRDYWIVKNSWGGGWGEGGYIRMARGHNLCAIASQACYPNL